MPELFRFTSLGVFGFFYIGGPFSLEASCADIYALLQKQHGAKNSETVFATNFAAKPHPLLVPFSFFPMPVRIVA